MKQKTKNNIALLGFMLLVSSIVFATTYIALMWNFTKNAAPTEAFTDGSNIMLQSQPITVTPPLAYVKDTQSGAFLASLFAQRRHDWDKAHEFLALSQTYDDQNFVLLRRAMIAAIAAGHYELGFDTAQKLIDLEDENPLAQIFLSLKHLKLKDYEKTLNVIENMGEDVVTDFFFPLVKVWALAGKGEYEIQGMDQNVIYAYHAIAAALSLDKKADAVIMLEKTLRSGDMQANDLERLADIYISMDQKERALALYQDILKFMPQNRLLASKIETITNGSALYGLGPPKTPQTGVAQALYDTALLLYNEQSDDSAHIFASLSLYLDPSLEASTLLMAAIASRQEQYADAIEYYRSIPETSFAYQEIRLQIASILEKKGKTDEAMQTLRMLADDQKIIDAQIQIGDIHRKAKDFDIAIDAYNKAVEMLGGHISSDYWHIHYLRGMAYERAGNWEMAEKDLVAALEFQPNDPHILNYLGYSWADKGKRLDEALIMIKQAVRLRPEDGYITDSLGWVLYRLGKFDEALPHLERAVDLLPDDPIINDHLGDLYWQLSRKREARFQWERARNNIAEGEELELMAAIEEKLKFGMDLREAGTIMEAKNTKDGDLSGL